MELVICIWSRGDQKYLVDASADSWTGNAKEAKTFRSAGLADIYCRDHELKKVDLVIQREGRPTVRVPIR
jgi:hypothetical protein